MTFINLTTKNYKMSTDRESGRGHKGAKVIRGYKGYKRNPEHDIHLNDETHNFLFFSLFLFLLCW
jgi:hypothetical protein